MTMSGAAPSGRKLNVAVIFGGRSTEHEVSIRSASSIIQALDPGRYNVIPLLITHAGEWLSPVRSAKFLTGVTRPLLTPRARPVDSSPGALISISSPRPDRLVDVVFPVLHGTFGEDGTMQGLLEMSGIPYVGSGVLGSAVGMDKEVMKRLFHQARIPTPRFVSVRHWEWTADREGTLARIIAGLSFPMFSKPANSGSSVGIRKVHDSRELPACLDEAFLYDRKALVEEGIAGRELECSVLGNESPQAAEVGEIIPGSEFYDYEEKYLKDTTRLVIPADLKPELRERIRRLAVEAYQVCGCEGLARVDFFLEAVTDRVLVNEINTIPGFTSISMYPKLWEHAGLPFACLLDRLIALAIDRKIKSSKNEVSYRGPVLT